MTARVPSVTALPGIPLRRPVVVEVPAARRPRIGAWLLVAVTVAAAFLVLVYSRITLDRAAFVLERIETRMQVEESRYWELRLEAAELQSPERITAAAAEMGLIYPERVETVEVPGLGAPGPGTEERWAELKTLLTARP